MPKQTDDDNHMKSLHRELLRIAFLGNGILLTSFIWQGLANDWHQALLWLLSASLLWLYVYRCTHQNVLLNRSETDSPLYPSLGWGNRVTLARGGLIALTGGFLLHPTTSTSLAWLPASSYTLAAILDRCDGYLARRCRQTTLLGSELDIRFDALGLVVAPLLAILHGRLHASYLLLSAAFYLYRWSLLRRQHLNLPLQPLPENPLRRTLAGFQMGFVAVALWPWLSAELTRTAGIALMLPVLFGFVADWLVVCGTLPTQRYVDLAKFGERRFLPGLRVIAALIGFFSVSGMITTGGQPAFIALLSTLLLLGFAGRWAALAWLLYLGGAGGEFIQPLIKDALIVTNSWLMLLGTGRSSLWRCGEAWLQRYDGA